MTIQSTNDDFRVTPNQKLIAAKALEALTQQDMNPEDPQIENFARAMVVIHRSGLGPYFGRGFSTSMNNRRRLNPEQVERETRYADEKSAELQEAINQDTSSAARRLQANKVRVDQERAEALLLWEQERQQRDEQQRLANERRQRRNLLARRQREARRIDQTA